MLRTALIAAISTGFVLLIGRGLIPTPAHPPVYALCVILDPALPGVPYVAAGLFDGKTLICNIR